MKEMKEPFMKERINGAINATKIHSEHVLMSSFYARPNVVLCISALFSTIDPLCLCKVSKSKGEQSAPLFRSIKPRELEKRGFLI